LIKKSFLHAFFLASCVLTLCIFICTAQELRWNWCVIDLETIAFPAGFKFGVATSEYQISGNYCFYAGEKQKDCPLSNWSQFEKLKTPAGKPRVDPVGKGVNHWEKFKEDVQLIKNLGVTVYRCSIDWARVQPHEGYFDTVALQHYHELFDELAKNNIEVMVTLHHFVNPLWFENKSAFEREENISYFIEFAKRVFTEFNTKVSYWCTINEPGVYAAQTYITNTFPRPSHSRLGFPCNLKRGACLYGAALVTKNLMLAHIKTYQALKALPGGKNAQIGIVHDIIQFEPYHAHNWLERQVARFLGHYYCDAITQFLLSGKLKLTTYTSSVRLEYTGIRDTQDFIGLNYYSHILINWRDFSMPYVRPCDIKTDMYYSMYPEGIYRAIQDLSKLKKPIFITENGLADAHDKNRELWYKRYLYAVSKAIQEGADVRMFLAWSLFDNYEWNLGFAKKFGLYSVDQTSYKRTLKDGARYFQKIAIKQKRH
jgi:beta-glucosidase